MTTISSKWCICRHALIFVTVSFFPCIPYLFYKLKHFGASAMPFQKSYHIFNDEESNHILSRSWPQDRHSLRFREKRKLQGYDITCIWTEGSAHKRLLAVQSSEENETFHNWWRESANTKKQPEPKCTSVTQTGREMCTTISKRRTGFSANVDWPPETTWEVFSLSCTRLDSRVECPSLPPSPPAHTHMHQPPHPCEAMGQSACQENIN